MGAQDNTGWTRRGKTENRTNGDRTIPLFVEWFLDTEKQSHFGRRYSSRNMGCVEKSLPSLLSCGSRLEETHCLASALARGTESHM